MQPLSVRTAALVCLIAQLTSAQNALISNFRLGGSGNDSINATATDAAGSIYVVGMTFSFDLPVVNAEQGSNRGTQLIYSTDSGATWQPVSNPFPNANPLQPLQLAVDPTNSGIVYIGSGGSVCKSVDGGKTFQCGELGFKSAQTAISSLAVDPSRPSTIYASATVNGGVYKSTNGGQSWKKSSHGLPTAGSISSVVIDPFDHSVLYAWDGNGGFVSKDAGASWARTTLPWPRADVAGGAFAFDPVQAGILYGPGIVNGKYTVQKSSDNGATWTQLNLPFASCCVTPDPQISGVLYASASPGVIWKSTDGGVSWIQLPLPAGGSGPIAIDPGNDQIVLSAGEFRSTDGGKSWVATNASRVVNAVFAPSMPNVVYGTALITSDAFVAKFLPDGRTPVFATYFGGMGNEVGNNIAVDSSGNIWIAGITSSYDLTVTPGAFQSIYSGASMGFAAKFSSNGKVLASTYLTADPYNQGFGIALSPSGNAWFTGPGPASAGAVIKSVLLELDSDLSRMLFSTVVDGSFDSGGKGIAIDTAGNVLVAGSTTDPNFPVTPGIFTAGSRTANAPKAFLLKLDPNGNTIYSTVFGGSRGAPTQQLPEGEHDEAVALATDGAGNVYVTGTTSSVDFPTTQGAYQTAFGSGCTYPAFANNTGFIGTIFTFLVDDVFVLKLSADGSKPLYSTLLGGSCYDRSTAIAVDSAGRAYVTGETDSGDFPLSGAVEGAPALRKFLSFTSELSADGSSLLFSTYLEAGAQPSVAVALNGNIVVGGSAGPGAQTAEESGFLNPFPATATDGAITILNPSTTGTLSLTQILNAFSLQPGPVAPGEIVALTVPNNARRLSTQDLGLNPTVPLPTSLLGRQVTFDNRPAYIISVSQDRIVCVAPVEIAGQAYTAVQVSFEGSLSNVLTVDVAPTALGLLSANGSGSGDANARNADGSLNSAQNPAQRGSTVTVFFTGGGATDPPEVDGAIVQSEGIMPKTLIVSNFSHTTVHRERQRPSSVKGTGETQSVHALAGFVPGIFAYPIAIPNDPNLPKQIGIVLSSSSSTSQSLSIYVQ